MVAIVYYQLAQVVAVFSDNLVVVVGMLDLRARGRSGGRFGGEGRVANTRYVGGAYKAVIRGL